MDWYTYLFDTLLAWMNSLSHSINERIRYILESDAIIRSLNELADYDGYVPDNWLVWYETLKSHEPTHRQVDEILDRVAYKVAF